MGKSSETQRMPIGFRPRRHPTHGCCNARKKKVQLVILSFTIYHDHYFYFLVAFFVYSAVVASNVIRTYFGGTMRSRIPFHVLYYSPTPPGRTDVIRDTADLS